MSFNYKDKWNRFHIKKVTESDPYPTNNAYIYSFYAYMLGLYDRTNYPILPSFGELKGFHRHPDQPSIAISHDEYVGVAGISYMRAKLIDSLGSNETHYQFCDLPGFVPTPLYKLNPIRVIKDLYALSKEKDEKGNNNSRKATVKYPYIWPIAFWHRAPVQYFYKRCANRPVFPFLCLAFIIASLFTIFGKGSKVMLGFKLMKLNDDGANLSEKLVTAVYKKYVNFEKEVDNYITDKDCPILLRVKERYPTTNCII